VVRGVLDAARMSADLGRRTRRKRLSEGLRALRGAVPRIATPTLVPVTFLALAVVAGLIVLGDFCGAVATLAKGLFVVFVVLCLFFVASAERPNEQELKLKRPDVAGRRGEGGHEQA
jgi:uncharacterized membrane protein YtjA (UPF0391 family)